MMMIGIGTPNSQSKIGIAFSSLPGSRHEPPFVPRSVAMLSALDCGEARGERAKQQRGAHPERELHRVQPGAIERVFGLVDDIVAPLLRVGVAHAGLPGDEMGDIGPVIWL